MITVTLSLAVWLALSIIFATVIARGGIKPRKQPKQLYCSTTCKYPSCDCDTRYIHSMYGGDIH